MARPPAATFVRVAKRVAERKGHLFDRALRPATLPPLLFASLGAKVTRSITHCCPPPAATFVCVAGRVAEREGHLFDRASRPPPPAATLVRVALREGQPFDRVLRPAPLQPLALPGAKVDRSIARHGQPRRQARRSPV